MVEQRGTPFPKWLQVLILHFWLSRKGKTGVHEFSSFFLAKFHLDHLA